MALEGLENFCYFVVTLNNRACPRRAQTCVRACCQGRGFYPTWRTSCDTCIKISNRRFSSCNLASFLSTEIWK